MNDTDFFLTCEARFEIKRFQAARMSNDKNIKRQQKGARKDFQTAMKNLIFRSLLANKNGNDRQLEWF